MCRHCEDNREWSEKPLNEVEQAQILEETILEDNE